MSVHGALFTLQLQRELLERNDICGSVLHEQQHVRQRSGIYPEGEAAVVSILEALSERHDLLEQGAMHGERRDSRK